jgi:hypothetical protein
MAGLDNAGLVLSPETEADDLADRTIMRSTCSDTISTPALGQLVSFTLDASILASRNTTLLFTDVESGSLSYHRLLVTEYDPDTFAGSGICTASGETVESSSWVVRVIPGQPSGGGGIAPTSVAFLDDAVAILTAAPYQITLPAGIQNGDLIVASVARITSTAASLQTPAGFSRFGDINNTFLYAKIADGSEASQTIEWEVLSGNTLFDAAIAVQVFRPDTPAQRLSIGSSVVDTFAPLSVVVAASGGDGPLIVFGSARMETGATPTVAFSTTADGVTTDDNSVIGIELAYKIYDTSPADVTITVNDLGSVAIQGWYISLYVPGSEPGDTTVLEDVGGGVAGLPAVDGSLVDLSNNPAVSAGVAKILFEQTFGTGSNPSCFFNPSGYSRIVATLTGLIPTVNNVIGHMRLSNDGATYFSGAGTYSWTQNTVSLTHSPTNTVDTNDTMIDLVVGLGNVAGETADITIEFWSDVNATDKAIWFDWKGKQMSHTPTNVGVNGQGNTRNTVGPLRGFQLFTSNATNTFASGHVRVVGYK